MDPERLEQLLGLIEKARERGMSDREINSRLRRNRDVPFNSVFSVEVAGEAGGLITPEGVLSEEEQQAQIEDRSDAADFLRLTGNALTLGGGDELAAALAGLTTMIGGGTDPQSMARGASVASGVHERASEQEELARENLGGVGEIGAEVTGGLLGLVGLAPSAFRALGRAPGAIRRGTQVLRGVGGREAAEAIGREVPKMIGPMARGAAEGGAIGAGGVAAEQALRAEGSVGERLGAIDPTTTLGGGLLGAGLGLFARGVPAIRERIRAPEESGEVLASAVRSEGNVTGRASRTEEAIAGRKSQAREELILPLEAQGKDIPLEVTETVLKNPVLREQARATAPHVVRSAEAVAAGERASSIPLTAEEALSIRRGIHQRASAFKKAAGGDLAASVDPVDVKKAERAFDELDEVMSERLEGFPEFQARWAREKATGRALLTGRKVANRPADDVVALWEGRPPADKSLKRVFPNGLPDDPQVRKAFREGLATELIANLEEGKAGVRSFIDKVRTGSQTREKMKIVLGGEENLNRFVQAVEAEGRIMSRAEMTQELVKAAGFLTLGTSLFGGAGIDLLF